MWNSSEKIVPVPCRTVVSCCHRKVAITTVGEWIDTKTGKIIDAPLWWCELKDWLARNQLRIQF
jgi:UDP-N-acetyl-D-mannosaminuronic acid transferase (WecB/TagA/CpsF family)